MDSKINFLKSKIFFIPNLILNIAFFPVRLFFSKYVKKNDNLRKNQELQQEEKDNFEYYFNSDISIELKFDKACEFLKSFTSLTNEQQLDFYGYRLSFMS